VISTQKEGNNPGRRGEPGCDPLSVHPFCQLRRSGVITENLRQALHLLHNFELGEIRDKIALIGQP
jgi:hypothetical protein